MSSTATPPTIDTSPETRKSGSAAVGSMTTDQPTAPAAARASASTIDSPDHQQISHQLDERRPSQSIPPNPKSPQQQQPPSQRSMNHEEKRAEFLHPPTLQNKALSSPAMNPPCTVDVKELWRARDFSHVHDSGDFPHKPLSVTVVQAAHRFSTKAQDEPGRGDQSWQTLFFELCFFYHAYIPQQQLHVLRIVGTCDVYIWLSLRVTGEGLFSDTAFKYSFIQRRADRFVLGAEKYFAPVAPP